MNRLEKIKAQKLKNSPEKQDEKVALIQDYEIKVKTPRREYTLEVRDITANEAIEKVKEEYPNFKEFEYKTITYKRTGKKGEFIKRIDPPEKIEQRWQKKKDHIRELSDNVSRLKNRITRDLKGDDEKLFLTALIIAVILRIGERIGNEQSANYVKTSKDDERKRAYGVSGFKKSHAEITGNKVHLTYIGKKGVPQDKSFSDEKIAKALQTAIKRSPTAFIFTTSSGQKIGANQVNDYLKDFNITAKGIRGYYCNRGVLDKLKETTPEETDKKRKKQLNIILKSVSAKVGHGASVLKNQYLMPEVITYWIDKGEVFDIKEAGYVMDKGGEMPKDEDSNNLNTNKNGNEIIKGTRSTTIRTISETTSRDNRGGESAIHSDRGSDFKRQDEDRLKAYVEAFGDGGEASKVKIVIHNNTTSVSDTDAQKAILDYLKSLGSISSKNFFTNTIYKIGQDIHKYDVIFYLNHKYHEPHSNSWRAVALKYKTTVEEAYNNALFSDDEVPSFIRIWREGNVINYVAATEFPLFGNYTGDMYDEKGNLKQEVKDNAIGILKERLLVNEKSDIIKKETGGEINSDKHNVSFHQGLHMYQWNFNRGDFDRVKNSDFDSSDNLVLKKEWLSDKESAEKVVEEKERWSFYRGRVFASKQKMEKGGITSEDIITRYNLTGKTSVPIRFKGDNKTYFTKRLSIDRKFIFVVDNANKSHAKKITDIVHINGKNIVLENGGNINEKSTSHHESRIPTNNKDMEQGGKIPQRYKDMGFSYVGQKKKSIRPEKKWMVLAKKGDKYKVVHGGQKGMEDYSQHRDKKRQRRFWERMGGFDSERTHDPFSPLYWHKKFGTWEEGGSIDIDQDYNDDDNDTEFKKGGEFSENELLNNKIYFNGDYSIKRILEIIQDRKINTKKYVHPNNKLLIKKIYLKGDYTIKRLFEIIQQRIDNIFGNGGEIETIVTPDGSQGGIFKGDSHAESPVGGMPTVIPETGQHLLVEGEEALLVPKVATLTQKVRLVGKPKAVLSKINEMADGANFSEEEAKLEILESKQKGGIMKKRIRYISGDTVTANAGAMVINKKNTQSEQTISCSGTPVGIASKVNELGGNGVKFSDEPATCMVLNKNEIKAETMKIGKKRLDNKMEKGGRYPIGNEGIIKYENKYGSLELELVGDYRGIEGIRGKDLPDDLKFPMETAEQIALITDNRGIQLAFEYPKLEKAYVLVHNSPSTAAIAKIKNINFKEGVIAKDELAKGKSYHPYYEKGGKFKNQYEGKTAQEVWDNLWTDKERNLFLGDHLPFSTSSKLSRYMYDNKDKKYHELPNEIKEMVDIHVKNGQYEKGGDINVQEIMDKNNKRIDDMVADWNKEGRAFSSLNHEDSLFFERIGIPSTKVGTTSQTGNDAVYYNTEIYSSGHNALRGIKGKVMAKGGGIYDEFMLEYKIIENGDYRGLGTVISKSLKEINEKIIELGINNGYTIKGWNGNKWITLVDIKNSGSKELGGSVLDKQIYWTLPEVTPTHTQAGTNIVIEKQGAPVKHPHGQYQLYRVYMESPDGNKYWMQTGLSEDKARKRAGDLKYTIEAGYKIADQIKQAYTKK